MHPGASVLPTISDSLFKGLLWWTLIVFTTVFVTYQYLVLMFWPPAAHFYQGVWPYTLSPRAQYFYLSLGPAVQGYQLVPDVIALMMLCTWVSLCLCPAALPAAVSGPWLRPCPPCLLVQA
jgi:hypothetical protein